MHTTKQEVHCESEFKQGDRIDRATDYSDRLVIVAPPQFLRHHGEFAWVYTVRGLNSKSYLPVGKTQELGVSYVDAKYELIPITDTEYVEGDVLLTNQQNWEAVIKGVGYDSAGDVEYLCEVTKGNYVGDSFTLRQSVLEAEPYKLKLPKVTPTVHTATITFKGETCSYTELIADALKDRLSQMNLDSRVDIEVKTVNYTSARVLLPRMY